MSVKDALKKPYFLIKHPYPLWLHVFNRRSRNLFKQHPPQLNGVQNRIVSELLEKGISFSSLDELFPNQDVLQTLLAYTEPLRKTAVVNAKKDFLLSLLPTKRPINLSEPFTALALRDFVLDIVSSYLKMWPRYTYSSLQVTLPVSESDTPKHSQRWHRDPQELKQLKMFIYLSEVTPLHGPFTYVTRSNHGGKYERLFPQHPPAGCYPPENAVDNAIDSEDLVVATGKPGTVIFCDTSGLHRGGFATGGERVMYTASYNAPSYVEQPFYTKSPGWDTGLSPLQRFALDA